jgi:hypothetical protein
MYEDELARRTALALERYVRHEAAITSTLAWRLRRIYTRLPDYVATGDFMPLSGREEAALRLLADNPSIAAGARHMRVSIRVFELLLWQCVRTIHDNLLRWPAGGDGAAGERVPRRPPPELWPSREAAVSLDNSV